MAGEACRKGECGSREDPSRYGSSNRECHIGQRVVEEHLQGVQDECILHEVHHAVEEARETADARPVTVGEKEEGNHPADGDAPALRHVKDAQLMQYDREREHQCDVDEHVGREVNAPHLQIAEDQDEYGEQRKETGRLRDQIGSTFHECVHGDLLWGYNLCGGHR